MELDGCLLRIGNGSIVSTNEINSSLRRAVKEGEARTFYPAASGALPTIIVLSLYRPTKKLQLLHPDEYCLLASDRVQAPVLSRSGASPAYSH